MSTACAEGAERVALEIRGSYGRRLQLHPFHVRYEERPDLVSEAADLRSLGDRKRRFVLELQKGLLPIREGPTADPIDHQLKPVRKDQVLERRLIDSELAPWYGRAAAR